MTRTYASSSAKDEVLAFGPKRLPGALETSHLGPNAADSGSAHVHARGEPEPSLDQILDERDFQREMHEKWLREGDPDLRELLGEG